MSVSGPLRTTALVAALALAMVAAAALLWARGSRFGLAAVPPAGQQRCVAAQLALSAGRAGVALLPGTAFGPAGAGYLRLAYTQAEADLRTGLERIGNHLADRRAPVGS